MSTIRTSRRTWGRITCQLAALVALGAAGCSDSNGGGSGTGGAATGGGSTGGASTGGASTGGATAGGAGGKGGAGGSTGGTAGGAAGGSVGGGAGGAGGAVLKDIVDTAVAAGFTKLAAAVTAADLVTTLKGAGPFTVFAPTDAAFAKLPAGTLDNLLKPENKAALQDILKYHVVAGKVTSADVVKVSHATTVQGQDVAVMVDGAKVKINEANVTAVDVAASNGVIHVIDTVIMPPSKDIVDTAVAAGSFTTLASALTAAELVTTLKGTGPFTVFAPTDAAFAKLPAGTVTDLLKPENKAKLQAVLKYHVVAGRVYAGDVVKLTSAKTVNGADVAVAVSGGAVKLNTTSTVTSVNVLATNGVIHVIDTVLLPPTN